jgi:hypothetical protein
MKNADEPMHPAPYTSQDGMVYHDVYFGLTKREYFAALAMQALASNPDWAKTMRVPDDWDEFKDSSAKGAVELADAVMKELDNSL